MIKCQYYCPSKNVRISKAETVKTSLKSPILCFVRSLIMPQQGWISKEVTDPIEESRPISKAEKPLL